MLAKVCCDHVYSMCSWLALAPRLRTCKARVSQPLAYCSGGICKWCWCNRALRERVANGAVC